MWDGASLSANWSINLSGMDEPSSKSTVGIPPAKPAMSASTSWKIFHWTCANGCVQSVASAMTGISMLQEIFWPRGSRHRPVEEVSDLLRDAKATPNEAGKPIREDGKPLPFDMGWMSPRVPVILERRAAEAADN